MSPDCTTRAVPAGANEVPKMVARPPGEMVITAGRLIPLPTMPPLLLMAGTDPAGETVSDTGTTAGELPAPVAVIVIVAEEVPAASDWLNTATAILALPTPLAGITANQPAAAALTVAVHVSEP